MNEKLNSSHTMGDHDDLQARYVPESGMQVVSEVIGEWDTTLKLENVDENGEKTTEVVQKTNHKRSIKVRPMPFGVSTQEELQEMLVRKAAPITVRPLTRFPRKKTQELQTLVGGDAQYPFVDPAAEEYFLRAAREIQPAEILLVGDMLDLTHHSKYDHRREWVGTTQQGIDDYTKFLAELRANSPNSKIVVVHGNHEQRLINDIERSNAELAGIRRGLGGKAVLSVQYLCNYDDLEIEYVDGYPSATYWLEDNLKAVHGTNTKKAGFNVGKYLQEEHESTIFGHTHRMELAHRTIAKRFGAQTLVAASPGALALTDGTVPGFNHSPNADGGVTKKSEDWQQGLLLITREGLHHTIEPARFTERGFRLEGKQYGPVA